ncbi:hypothetical protein DVH24_024620 [Malus domestica]|uniref:RSE1/DDB1/CPSF1 C-terminal domain-containing protein n=1 Tax=Malus domestica TaxID=3750 RepID=A0A498JIP4_MALDO|nr:hypothetical protein DVH24_024620 [Malus domestica]
MLNPDSMHCFEGPEWLHLRRGRESFARGPLVKVDPQGRFGGVLVYGFQMIILKAAEGGSGLVGDDDGFGSGGAISARVESSYIFNLGDMDMKHVKDFTFVHGYIEPVLVILHEQKLTWAGHVSWKHHACMISALSISTTLKQHPHIWSAVNLPHDSYNLLAVPSPIGGVLFLTVELDAANATWLLNDVALLSTKTGELLLLTLVYDGRLVSEVYAKDFKGPKITLNKWNGTELNGVAFFDVPPFLLRLVVADERKNIQIFFYAPKRSESWKGQKLLSRAKFLVGTHVTKFLRLQMLSNSGTNPGSNKTNCYALLFGTLDGSIGCVMPLDELTFRRLQSLQKKLVDAVAHVAGLNPRAFRQFRSNGKAYLPGPDTIVDCKLLTQ